MNISGYEFCKENKDHLLEFLKVAEEKKHSEKCDHKTYKSLQPHCPLPKGIKEALRNYDPDKIEVIDVIVSSDEEMPVVNEIVESEDKPTVNLDQLNRNIIQVIKENSNVQIIMKTLNSCDDLANAFKVLSNKIDFNEGVQLGDMLKAHGVITNTDIVKFYFKNLFLNKLNNYTEDLEGKLENGPLPLCAQYPKVVRPEISEYLLNSTVSTAFFQFLGKLNQEFKAQLLRDFLMNKKSLEEKDFSLLEIMLNNIDFDTTSKLIEVLFMESEKFSFNNAFGKLLKNVIEISKRNVHHFEKPLRNIVLCHKSSWKRKLTNLFEQYLKENDSLGRSQLF